jgi:hypothetical protein
MLADPAYHSFSHQHHAYRARGEYVTHLRRLADLVGRDRLHVIEAERFFARPADVYDEICDFLGLPTYFERPAFEQHNARPRQADMDPGLRRELTAYYQRHDEALSSWLGHTPVWRRPA